VDYEGAVSLALPLQSLFCWKFVCNSRKFAPIR